MMSSISTASLFATMAANIGTAQNQEAQDAFEVGSNKLANDLAGYGTSAGALTTTNSVASRLASYVNNAQTLSDKLTVQDQALTQVSTAAQGAHDAVAEALANNNAADLLTTLQGQLSTAADALNVQYNGQYLFSGGQSSTAPVAANQLSDLTAASPPSSVFKNGQTPQVSRLDDHTVIQTGVLASDAGGPLLSALAAVQAYSDGPNGPLTGALTPAQSTFLSGVLSQFSTALSSANTTAANTGVIQQQVSAATTQLSAQQTTLNSVVSNLTVPDEAQVATQLSLAQTTLQASAQVFSALQSDSLLNILSPSSGG